MSVTEEMNRKHKEDMRRLQRLRLFDDGFFNKCFDGETACVELIIRIILEKPDLKVVDVRTQAFLESLLKRSVRLDIMATDSTGRRFNIEVQRNDGGADKRRARYNSSMMDVNLLEKGQNFKDLPETFVIFITEHDVLGMGESVYEIERCFVKSGKRFDDGSHIIYVNGECRDDSPVGKLMHDFNCTSPSDMCYNVLAERVRYFKESEEGFNTMCKVFEEYFKEGRKEGRMEGEYEAKKKLALNLLSSGKFSIEEISFFCGLSIDEIKKLKAN